MKKLAALLLAGGMLVSTVGCPPSTPEKKKEPAKPVAPADAGKKMNGEMPKAGGGEEKKTDATAPAPAPAPAPTEEKKDG